jgi:hypothetical protein
MPGGGSMSGGEIMSEESVLHIYAPAPDRVWIARGHCPTCGKRRFFVFKHTPWYGADACCLKCGDRWSEGERLARPFCRGWRKDSIKRAKKMYRKWKGVISDHAVESA